MPVHRSSSLLQRVAVGISASVVVVACSPGSDGPPIDGRTEVVGGSSFGTGEGEDVVAVTAAPAGRWGSGRALEVHPTPDGGRVVVTTVGIVATADDGAASDPRPIAEFAAAGSPDASTVTADGRNVVVATELPSAVVWYDLEAGGEIGRSDLPLGTTVRELDARRASGDLVIVTSDGILRVPTAGGAVETMLPEPVGATARLSDGRLAAPILDGAELAVVGEAGIERRPLDVPAEAVLDDAKSSEDGSLLAVSYGVGDDDIVKLSSIVLIDPETFAVIATIDLDRSLPATDWAVTSNGVVVADETSLSAWSATGEPVATAASPIENPIASVHPVSQGAILIHRAGAITSWTPGGSEPTVIADDGTTIRSVSADGDRLTTVDLFGAVRTVGFDVGSVAADTRFATGEIADVAHLPDGSAVAIGTTAGQAFVLDPSLATQLTVDVGQGLHVDAVGFQPRTGQVVTGLAERVGDLAFDDTVTLWDAAGAEPQVQIGGEAEDVAGCGFFVNAIEFSPDGTVMTALSHDFSLTLLDAASGEVLSKLPPAPSTILAAGFSPGGDVIVTSSDDSTVNVWDVSDPTTPSVLATYRSVPGGYQSLELLDDGSMVAADLTGRLSVVDPMNGSELRLIADTGARSPAIDVADDIGVVASALEGGSIGLWSTTTGQPLATLDGHVDDVVAISFGADGDSIVTASKDGTARTWSLEIDQA